MLETQIYHIWNISVIFVVFKFYLNSRNVCLRQPYARTRLTDERTDGRTDTPTNRQTERLTQRKKKHTHVQTFSHYNIIKSRSTTVCGRITDPQSKKNTFFIEGNSEWKKIIHFFGLKTCIGVDFWICWTLWVQAHCLLSTLFTICVCENFSRGSEASIVNDFEIFNLSTWVWKKNIPSPIIAVAHTVKRGFMVR